MANKAYKFRLYPTQEQEQLLTKTFGCVRFVYNKMLAERMETYEPFKDDKEALKKQKKIPDSCKVQKGISMAQRSRQPCVGKRSTEFAEGIPKLLIWSC